jgi:SAM-dependent methyltransferase
MPALGSDRLAALARPLTGERIRRAIGRLRRAPSGPRPVIRDRGDRGETEVDSYWAGHTVRAPSFLSRRASERYLEWRFREYPLFRELTGLWGNHEGEVVMDYGCGPGNDLTGLALHSGARRLIGVDVSEAALGRAAERLALHGVEPGRVELLRISDSDPAVPLEDGSVDFALSLGVIRHTSDPLVVLREIARVMKPGATGRIMVYNRDSIWLHLYTAYERMVLEGAFAGLDVESAFARNTDGPDCPIARCYRHGDFLALLSEAGLEGRYAGGYLSRQELESLETGWSRALADERLADAHRDFLRQLAFDPAGRPMHRGFHAGVGGVYWIRRAEPERGVASP